MDGNQSERLPIAVSVSGSGAFSNFARRCDRILDAHRTERCFQERPGKAHILIVEVSSAVHAVRVLALSDNNRCLLIGHSEGGLVVSRVAAENPFVTNVASLAGGGPTQLFDFIEAARAGHLYPELPADPDRQVGQLLVDVAAIRSDPDNSEKLFLGHPYRRWSTFWNSSPLEELLRTKARIFIAQGTADKNVSVTSFDILYATLLAHGADVTARRIPGADHAFGIRDQPGRDGWKEMFEDVRNWFFK